ncbi:hypothetical protein CDD81_2466 [Ophiocordyceps australis]|uniref:Formyl transferase N-terminal domain-containing protein n=1 Tax=Ophiocordyceps australis TaxID=1399860 RepID=A0A2C5XXJ8_9HYPO|nr:hypothetical protein CDD81_2466 [Ophiocordyceps australis]
MVLGFVRHGAFFRQPLLATTGRLCLVTSPGRRFSTPASPKRSDPLRILFCGSDAFSLSSLVALQDEKVANPELIEAIEVFMLPVKKSGRFFKLRREVPCEVFANLKKLKIHERETFHKWELPPGINLIIAVSFGLFVPGRLIRAAKYGGLNIHPSFLPDLRGPAPLHRAMLRWDRHFGISLQTLDERRFDHGVVLAQTPRPGEPIAHDAHLKDVWSRASEAGAQMLMQGLRDGLHVPPYRSVIPEEEEKDLTHAHKVVKADSYVQWEKWKTFGDFDLRYRVVNWVWFWAYNRLNTLSRVIIHEMRPCSMESIESRIHQKGTLSVTDQMVGQRLEIPVVIFDKHSLAMRIGDEDQGEWVELQNVKSENEKCRKDVAKALDRYIQYQETEETGLTHQGGSEHEAQ